MLDRPDRWAGTTAGAGWTADGNGAGSGTARECSFRLRGDDRALLVHIADFQCLGKLFRGILAEIEFDGGVGVEIIEGCMTPELDPAVLEIIGKRFSLLDQDKSFAILDDHPDNADKPYRMGEDPLGGCLHPPDTLPLR